MFLHLGSNVIIPVKQVITINNYQQHDCAINKEFLQTMQEEKMIIDISENNPKSFVVTDKITYLSPISSQTLKKRSRKIFISDESD
jgi:hypothetical protein